MSILIGCFLIFVCEQSLDLRLALFNERIVSQGCKNVSKLRLSLLTSNRRTILQLDIFNVAYINYSYGSQLILIEFYESTEI